MHEHFGLGHVEGASVVVVVVVAKVVARHVEVIGARTITGVFTDSAGTKSSFGFDWQPSGKKKRIFWLNFSSSLNSRMNEAFLKFELIRCDPNLSNLIDLTFRLPISDTPKDDLRGLSYKIFYS